jgi:hypothetical protein
LEPFVTETEVGGTPSKILKPSAEMVVLIIHSFIPEMIFTLFLYYAALFHIAKMEEDEIDEFIENSRVNNMTISSRCFFSLVGELHNRSFGFMPAKIKTILNLLGEDLGERTIFVQENNYKMPFKYSKLTVFEVLMEKLKEIEFIRSMIIQFVYSIQNPKLFKYLIKEFRVRRERETY